MVEMSCAYCGFTTKYRSNLQRHIEAHLARNARPLKISARNHNCPTCKTFWCEKRPEMINHYVTVHSAQVETKILDFKNVDDFLKWKVELEKEELSRYVKPRSDRQNSSHIATTYRCHREGFFVPKGREKKRNMKVLGSNKINSCCPAEIRVKFYSNGAVQAKFISGHFGHDMELGRIHLSKAQRLSIATKLANKVPFDAVLDSLRESMYNGDCERMHLVTRKDLYNVVRDLNLGSKVIKHGSALASVQSWINEISDTSNIIRFYKLPKEPHPDLEFDDFVLIIANDAQLEIISQFANNCVCFDNTRSSTQFDFEMTTMSVVDELDQGFPAAFMISNRLDFEVMVFFINVIKEIIGHYIVTSAFMSDMSDIYYNAWCEVMPQPGQRLFSSWQVHDAWRKNLKKIPDSVKKADIYAILCSLMEETDETNLHLLLDTTIQEMKNDEGTRHFAIYFQNEYAKSTKYWAYCYRKQLPVNTNLHLESMYNYIKHSYSQGRKNRRLDWMLNSLMDFLREKLYGRLICDYDNFIPSIMAIIHKCHEESQLMTDIQIEKIDEGWRVSYQNSDEVYTVTPSDKVCPCSLKCDMCVSCFHDYKCSCPDSVVKWHMCKHIHLIGTYFKSTSQPSASHEMSIVPNDVKEVLIKCKEPTTTEEIISLDKVQSQFDDIITMINTPSQLSYVEHRLSNIISVLKTTESAALPSLPQNNIIIARLTKVTENDLPAPMKLEN